MRRRSEYGPPVPDIPSVCGGFRLVAKCCGKSGYCGGGSGRACRHDDHAGRSGHQHGTISRKQTGGNCLRRSAHWSRVNSFRECLLSWECAWLAPGGGQGRQIIISPARHFLPGKRPLKRVTYLRMLSLLSPLPKPAGLIQICGTLESVPCFSRSPFDFLHDQFPVGLPFATIQRYFPSTQRGGTGVHVAAI